MRTARVSAAMIAALALASVTGGRAQEGWRPLFDGKTTTGWRGFRQQTMPDGWKVVDGALTRVGKAGDIVTIDQFDDFELSLEWNVSPGANSGVFFRVIEDDPVMWHTSPEVQVIDNNYKDALKPAQKAGANYDMHEPLRDVAKPAGSWNEMRILAKGNHVQHWLNGVKVVEYEIGSADWEQRLKKSKFNEYPQYARARKGYIGLQDHGDKVAYRNIRIRPLSNSSFD